MSKAKRGYGEGGIRQRKDGRWEASVRLEDGKRCFFYGKTRAEVRKQLNTALYEKQQGTLANPDRQTLAVFLSRWLEDTVKPKVRPRTYESYSGLVRVHIAPAAIGKKKLSKLTPQDLQAFLNAKSAEGLSARSVQYLHAVLRTALEKAHKWNIVSRNAAKLVDPPRVSREEVQPLTPEQAKAFLEAAKEDRLAALYTVAVALGLRQGEAFGLTWANVDFENQTLRVARALQRIEGKPQLVEPKTARSRRTLALPAFAIKALREHRQRQLEERLLAGSRWQDWNLVFCTTIGTPLDAHNIYRSFSRILAKAGLPKIRFHDLRHTAASLLLAQGIHPRIIMETLGHSQIGITLNLYAHVMPALQREAADSMQRLLGGRL